MITLLSLNARRRRLSRLEGGLNEAKERWPDVRDDLLDRVPELSPDSYDKLPASVQDRLPEQVKPKRRRLRKLVGLALVGGAVAAVVAATRDKQSGPQAPGDYSSSFGGGSMPSATQVKNDVKSAAQDAKHAAQDTASDLKDKAKDAADDAKATVDGDKLQDAANDAKNATHKAADSAKDAAKDAGKS